MTQDRITLLIVALWWVPCTITSAQQPRKQLDPAAWGSDHVGKPLPELTSGDECLFCHRDIGKTWSGNHHNQTIRAADTAPMALAALKQSPQLNDLAASVQLVLGGRQQLRFLKPAAEYGKLELLSVAWKPSKNEEGHLTNVDSPHWDAKRFGDSCAGCHATSVDARTRSFAAVSLDCVACHGDVPAEHSKQPASVLLSLHRQETAQVVTSACAQCHIRTGKSHSTGLPYPNQFVPGDNLFRNFTVDLSVAALAQLNPADRHVQENIRDVVLQGKEDVTCLSCHSVHGQSSRKHHRLASQELCNNCHQPTGPKKNLLIKPLEVHSTVCGY